jgi:hypothetical protein
MAMQAAGIKGPYWPREHTYSIGCLVSLGLGANSAELVTLEQGAKASPAIAKFWGASESSPPSSVNTFSECWGGNPPW